jgi:hypothetical protein
LTAEDAVEAAAFAALNVSAITTLLPVFQHVPENTNPPVLIVGSMDSDTNDIATKDGDDEHINITITAVVTAEERRPLRAIKRKVKELLNGHVVNGTDWTICFTYSGADSVLLADNGQDYVGNFHFSALALRAS